MTTVNDVSIISNTITGVRDLIASGVTDPISASRAGAEKFVLSEFPGKDVKYPVVVVTDSGFSTSKRGIGSEAQTVDIDVTIDVFARNVKERDILTGSIYDYLRTNQRDISGGISGTQTWGLYDFRLLNMFNINEEGIKGKKRKVIEGRYNYTTQP